MTGTAGAWSVSRSEFAAYVSGRFIGSDVREQAIGVGATVHLLANAMLARLDAVEIEAAVGNAVLLESQDAFVAGITRV